MKKISLFILFLCAFISPVFADSYLNLEQFLRGYLSVVTQTISIPNSYTSIVPKFTNVSLKSPLYPLLQKAIYLDIFPNAAMEDTGDMRRFVSIDWLKDIAFSLQNMQISQYAQSATKTQSGDFLSQSAVYQDVMYRLKSTYYFQSGLNQTWMIYWAVEWMVKWLDDPYTAFFPPVEAGQFEDQLQGQFFGIGAYVGMDQPGIFIITATIDGSPAQKAWLMAQDRIVQVDDHFIDAKVSLSQAVQWVKWPSGSEVTLKYLRNEKLLTVKVTRAQIVIPNIETKQYTWDNAWVCQISLHLFDFGLASRFNQAIGQFSKTHCTKYIFDLRNNPGGSLEEVSTMLDYFVPTESPILSVKTRTTEQVLLSSVSPYPKLTGEKIRILINKWSASASEIFAGVIREYVPGALLVGTQSYGKWSVQDVIYYDDGSLLKYTTAKWYTWKKDVNIDKIWLTPDVKIEDSVGSGKDAILDWALKN